MAVSLYRPIYETLYAYQETKKDTLYFTPRVQSLAAADEVIRPTTGVKEEMRKWLLRA